MSQSPDSDNRPGDNSSRTAVNVAGGSLGTVIAALAQQLSDTNPLKPWLLILAPGIAVGVSASWHRARKWASDRAKERAFRTHVNRMRITLNATIHNPTIPQQRRAEAKEELHELDRLVREQEWQRIRVLAEKLWRDD